MKIASDSFSLFFLLAHQPCTEVPKRVFGFLLVGNVGDESSQRCRFSFLADDVDHVLDPNYPSVSGEHPVLELIIISVLCSMPALGNRSFNVGLIYMIRPKIRLVAVLRR